MMDFSSDIGVRHTIAFPTLNIQHSLHVSATSVAFAREIRISIIAIVLGFSAVAIVKSVLNHREPTQ